ncbi:dTDP-4-dehydrorhamnose 3,5-epimerase [Aquirufa ecclesiirivi]
MIFEITSLEGLYIVKPQLLRDERGLFTRTFCKKEFAEIGFEKDFVQFNHSFNLKRGTLRGMHFQEAPFTETKLIRCVEGRVWDVAVDLRKESKTYLQYFGIELSKENMFSVLIPDGFAHGFLTLEDNSSLIYHHTEFFTPNKDRGILYNDPSIGIKWPIPISFISQKDTSYTLL